MSYELVELAQESIDTRTFENAVLGLLAREVGFDVGLFWTKGTKVEPTAVGFDRTTVDRMVRSQQYESEFRPVAEAARAARGVAVDSDVLGTKRLHQTNYYRELVAPCGGKCTLLACVPWGGRTIGAIMLGRTGGAFSVAEISRIESMLPGMGVARAAFGLPCHFPSLGVPTKGRLRSLLGLQPPTRVLESVETVSGALLVRDRGRFREMVACTCGSELVWTRAGLLDPRESGWPYVEFFHLAAAQAKQRRSALFVGCGGAVALRQFASVYPGLAMDLVECEPAVVRLAERWYDLRAIPNLTVHVDDGARFVAHAEPASWDVALIDAYDDATLASSFTRHAFFTALKRALHPGGAMAFNVIGSLAGRGPLRSVVSSARAVFDEVRLVPVVELDEAYAPDAPRNVVVIATRGE
jgi:hypothetical protein